MSPYSLPIYWDKLRGNFGVLIKVYTNFRAYYYYISFSFNFEKMFRIPPYGGRGPLHRSACASRRAARG